jgi:predicted RNA binding protein YcfA (HicA-like mRNA interferase family)
MKLPRDLHGSQLVKSLRVLGYAVGRQKGSHIRVTTQQDGENHEVIPNHQPIKNRNALRHPQTHRPPPRPDHKPASGKARFISWRVPENLLDRSSPALLRLKES